VAAELVGTSISSDFPFADAIESLAGDLANVYYVNARQRGYVVCEMTPDELRAEFRMVSTATEPGGDIATDAVWAIADGDPTPHEA
jgi:alkaline phosphatase D